MLYNGEYIIRYLGVIEASIIKLGTYIKFFGKTVLQTYLLRIFQNIFLK